MQCDSNYRFSVMVSVSIVIIYNFQLQLTKVVNATLKSSAATGYRYLSLQ